MNIAENKPPQTERRQNTANEIPAEDGKGAEAGWTSQCGEYSADVFADDEHIPHVNDCGEESETGEDWNQGLFQHNLLACKCSFKCSTGVVQQSYLLIQVGNQSYYFTAFSYVGLKKLIGLAMGIFQMFSDSVDAAVQKAVPVLVTGDAVGNELLANL